MNRSESAVRTQKVDPFLLHRLERMKQQHVTVQTMNQTVRGTLASIHADYIVLCAHTTTLYIQLGDIARVMLGPTHIRFLH